VIFARVRVADESLAFTPTSDAVAVRLTDRVALDDGDRVAFASVDDADADAFETAVEDDPTVADVRALGDADGRREYCVAVTDAGRLVAPDATAVRTRLTRVEVADGEWTVSLRAPDRAALVAFRDRCEVADVAFRVAQLSAQAPADADTGLTPGQREALSLAYERGYFDEPRESSLEELADELGVSSTAVGGRLRRGTARLVERVLGRD
jgi:predicted DNA binding protein